MVFDETIPPVALNGKTSGASARFSKMHGNSMSPMSRPLWMQSPDRSPYYGQHGLGR